MKTEEEIETFFKELYKNNDEYVDVNDVEVDFTSPAKLEVCVASMYEYVPVDFKYLLKVGEFFKTDKINLHKESYSGCETCDYGSSYQVTYYIEL